MNFRSSRRWMVASIPLVVIAFPLRSQVVFQADFNGSGTGTGETSNIATFGGTAALFQSGSTTATVSSAAPLLFTGELGYLSIYTPGSGTAGVNVTPTSAANCPDTWFVAQTGTMSFDTLNGGMDFFFTSSVSSSQWTGTGVDFRPIDISGGNGGLRIILNSPTTNKLQLELIAKNSAGTTVQNIYAANSVNLSANTLYHVAVTTSTNPSTGIVSINLYLAQGDTPINLYSSACLVATGTTTASLSGTGTNGITHAFNSVSGFWFGAGYSNSVPAKTTDFGSFRVYGSVPPVFYPAVYLPNYAHNVPSPEPTLPGNFDRFSPPATSVAPASGTPVSGEWTRTANAGDGMIVAGSQLTTSTGTSTGQDTSFLAFGENPSSLNLVLNDISRETSSDSNNSDNAAIRLSSSLPANSVYLVWPGNSNGAGTPMIVNQAQAWWIGPNIALSGASTSTPSSFLAPGMPVSLYGRNLTASIDGSSSSTSYIYIQAAGSAGQWVTPTSANPYKVDFTLPSTLSPNTTYEVWVHNSHGEHYGWGGPVMLTTGTSNSWSGSTYNVMSYGATGNGTANDTAAIQSAINAAKLVTNSTVYFPTGTYSCTGFDIPPGIRLNGVSPTGSNASILEFPSTAASGLMLGMPNTTANITVSNLGINANNSRNTYLVNGYGYAGGTGTVSQVCLINCVFNSAGHLTPVPEATFDAAAFSAGALSLTSTNGTTGLVVGQAITGTGLPSNEAIASISGSTVGLTGTTTASESTETITMPGNPSGTAGEGSLYVDPCSNIYMEGDTFAGAGITIINATQCAIDHCSFNADYDSPELNIKGDSSEMSYTYNTAQDYDHYLGYTYVPSTSSYTGDSVGWGWSQSPFFKGLDDAGARQNTYFGNNTSYNMGVRIGNPSGNNWGEQISFEQNWAQYVGSPASATSTGMTFGNLASEGLATYNQEIADGFFNSSTPQPIQTATPPVTPLIAVIVNGTGQGQWRDVGGINTSSGLVTLASGESWNVTPDSTSTIAIGWFVENVASYENLFQGKPDRVGPARSVSGYPGGTEGLYGITGFLPYGGVLNVSVDSNTYDYAGEGVNTVCMVPRDSTAVYVSPDYFHLYLNNTMHDCQQDIGEGLSASFSYTNTLPMAAGFGNLYRNNTANDSLNEGSGDTLYGMQIQSQPDGEPNGIDMNLVEENNLTDLAVGVNLFDDYSMNVEGNLLFENNNISQGSTTSAAISAATTEHPAESGSYGIDTPTGVKYGLGGNTWTGFGTAYVDGTAAAILQAPLHVYEESASVSLNVPATDIVTVWNDGSASESWSATSNASWLTLSPASGTVINEDAAGGFTITCKPAGLTAGTVYTGVITLTCASQIQNVLVSFIVNP